MVGGGTGSSAGWVSACWSQAGGQAERAEHRRLLEGGDVDQAAVFDAQHGEHEREERGLAGGGGGTRLRQAARWP